MNGLPFILTDSFHCQILNINNRLVDDVFGKDNMGKVQMEKVVMLIWQFRDDANVIQFMAQFVAKVSFLHRFVQERYHSTLSIDKV